MESENFHKSVSHRYDGTKHQFRDAVAEISPLPLPLSLLSLPSPPRMLEASLLPKVGLSTSPGAEQWFLLFGSHFCCSFHWSTGSVKVTSTDKASVCQLTLQALSQAIFFYFFEENVTFVTKKIQTIPNKVLVSASSPSVV